MNKENENMKEVKHYVCEICGTEYNEKMKATDCEKNHKKPKGIVDCRYTPKSSDNTGLPASVVIEFVNGEKVKYSRF